MARIRKSTSTEPHASSEVDPETGDDLRRFIDYAADMIAAQEAVRVSLMEAATALDKAVTGYDRTSLAIARRESDGIAVRLETNIDAAIQKVRNALTHPVVRAERVAREARMTAALAGLTGALIGSAASIVFLFIRIS